PPQGCAWRGLVMTTAIDASDVVHPELVAAKRAIALAPADAKLRAIESEGLRLSPIVKTGALARGDASRVLINSATAHGLTQASRDREGVEHVIRESLAGRSAGIGHGTRKHAAHAPEIGANAALRPLNIGEFLQLRLPPRRLMLAPWLS